MNSLEKYQCEKIIEYYDGPGTGVLLLKNSKFFFIADEDDMFLIYPYKNQDDFEFYLDLDIEDRIHYNDIVW